MGMCIETTAIVTYTCELSDEDVAKIKKYIDSHRPDYMEGEEYIEEEIINAVSELSSDLVIDLYRESTESDFMTNSIDWSEFEERTPQEILDDV